VTAQHAARSEVVAAVRGVADAHPDRTVFVGIDGFGGAGKSTLATAIAERVSRAVVVRVDDFWGPNIAEWDWLRFRAQLLEPLLAARPARYQVWNWVDDVGGEWVEVAPGRVVVVEGVSSTRTEAGVPWDLTVWVEAPRDVRLARALERDGPDLMRRWLDDWMPSEEAYAARERPRDRVDLVVDGDRT
jgi:uridine kinase